MVEDVRIMKKVITIIISLLLIFAGLWTFLRVLAFHALNVPFYRVIPKGVGPILLIIGVIIFL